MRVNVLTEASGHQGVAPVDMCSIDRSAQACEISTRQLQDCEANSIKAGSIGSHVGGQWQIGTASFGDHLTSGLSVLREEENFNLLDNCWSKWCQDA
jgi:hypothetical protein